MTPDFLIEFAIIPALSILPNKMTSREAKAMMVAIALQESRIEHRRQIGGPARGYWQFEQGGGVRGVLTHAASKPHIQIVLNELGYRAEADALECYTAIEHNDILAAAFARLLLWTLPDKLPEQGDVQGGWDQYMKAWRPGKPHREIWNSCFNQAWTTV